MTPVDIANLALGYCSARSIVNFEEKSREADYCNQFYEIARLTTLELTDWKFAQSFKELALASDKPLGGWRYAYSQPTKCVKFREILTDNQSGITESYGFGNVNGAAYGRGAQSFYNESDPDYTVGYKQGFGSDNNPAILFELGLDHDSGLQFIYTDVPNAVGRFTYDLTNTGIWIPSAQTALAWVLASHMAGPITRDTDYVKFCLQMAEQKSGVAQVSSANQGPRQIKTVTPSWIRNR
jgi:hypothetical protein